MAKIKSGKPHPKFGATKAQAERYQDSRAIRNDIFELAQLTRQLAESVATLCRVMPTTQAAPSAKTSTEENSGAPPTDSRTRKESAAGEDRVNHPGHYKRDGIEAIDVIEAWNLTFNPGNAVKYLSGHGHKNGANVIEDLRKARWHVEREISRLTKIATGKVAS